MLLFELGSQPCRPARYLPSVQKMDDGIKRDEKKERGGVVYNNIMVYLVILAGLVAGLVVIAIVAIMVDWNKRIDKQYYEVTILLGSGGHTGELCEMLHNFKMERLSKMNVLITATDKTSESFFRNYIRRDHASEEKSILGKLNVYYLPRTNEVKQSKISSVFTTIRSLATSFILIVKSLLNTTHFISNGPGTCVPIFYIFFLLKTIRLSNTKLIFIESWCRVKDLSLAGKLVKPIVNEFIVHWP